MKTIVQIFKVSAAVMAVWGLLALSAVIAAEVGFMSKEELKQALSDENLVILDVRTGRDWSSSEFKIKGAVRADPGDFTNWASTFKKDKTVVLYCA